MLEKGTVSPDQFRFFIGYSGWGGGQLEEEMETNSWIVARGFQEIFVPEKELWHDILNSMGGEYRFVSTFPEDPQLN